MKKSDMKRFVDAYKRTGGKYAFKYLDEAIYGLCKKYPAHANKEQVYAKIALVNNVYRTNIHMSKSGAEWTLAGYYVREKIDKYLSPLKDIKQFNQSTSTKIIKRHEELMRVTKRALGRNALSFCSKYLNFHFPNIIPIYDSRAKKTIWEYVGNSLDHLDYEDKINAEYAYYCAAILELIVVLKKYGVRNPSLKIIDVLLYDTLYED
jgi:hypothetical protein